jgi:REP element-mobilizing transposase RayT
VGGGEVAGMRRGRLKVGADRPVGFYHCISRVVDRRFIFEESEKEHFRTLMRECEGFCEVQVLTFCLMSNHFHILLEVPKRPDELPSADQILAKLERLSGHQDVGAARERLASFRQANDEEGERRWLEGYYARMWDLSAFMKLLKQRFTQWYNRRTGRKGTLWEDRFKSVVVEGAGAALVAMGAYIDLNPVRAGMVRDPKDYRWSGYGEAVAGQRRAKEGLQKLVTTFQTGRAEALSTSLETYRMLLYSEGTELNEAVGEGGRPVRGAMKHDEVLQVLADKGRLPLGQYLRCRVRYFCDGVVFGSREFVEDLFRTFRDRFGPRRKDGARRMRGLAGAELFTLRDLRLDVFG